MSLKFIHNFKLDGTDEDLEIETGTPQITQDLEYGNVIELDGGSSLKFSELLESVSGDLDRTFSFWANPNSFEAPVISYGSLVSPDAFVIYVGDTSSYVTFSDFSGDTVTSILTSESVWSFYVFVYSSGSMLIYVDGLLRENLTLGSLSTGIDDYLRIGTDGAGSYFSGYLSDLRIFDHSVDSETIEYMFSKGPNYEEPVGYDYIETLPSMGTGVHGTVICRDIYSLKEPGTESTSSLFARDGSNNLLESARFTHTDESIKASVRTTNTDGLSYMTSVIESSPEKTSFFSTSSDDTRKSVVFSSDGVRIISESPYGMYFGESKDFRIVFSGAEGDSLKIEALNESTGNYVTKLEIGSS